MRDLGLRRLIAAPDARLHLRVHETQLCNRPRHRPQFGPVVRLLLALVFVGQQEMWRRGAPVNPQPSRNMGVAPACFVLD